RRGGARFRRPGGARRAHRVPAGVAVSGPDAGMPLASTPLRRPDGRAPRVANLVYRDAHSDSRVLKTAASLQEAGAEVVVYGSARDRAGFPAGLTRTDDGIAIYR